MCERLAQYCQTVIDIHSESPSYLVYQFAVLSVIYFLFEGLLSVAVHSSTYLGFSRLLPECMILNHLLI